MKRSIIVGAALTCLIAGWAVAADMPVKAPGHFNRPACAQFGGFYLGGQAGVAGYNHHFNDLDAFAIEWVDSFLPNSTTHSGTGALAGAQAGYNWQSGCTVFGIETDWAWSSAKASDNIRDGDEPLGTLTDNITVTSKLRWFGTTRVRTGVVVDSLLLYVTGGLAYANFKRDLTFSFDCVGEGCSETFSSSKTRLGWTAGAGAEWAINNNWSLKTEALYMQFQKDQSTVTSQIIADPGTQTRFKHDDSAWVGRIGLNYRFNQY
jgi:outer membrane immunogenic protein